MSIYRVTSMSAVVILCLVSFVAGYRTGYIQALAVCQREIMRVNNERAAQIQSILTKYQADNAQSPAAPSP